MTSGSVAWIIILDFQILGMMKCCPLFSFNCIQICLTEIINCICFDLIVNNLYDCLMLYSTCFLELANLANYSAKSFYLHLQFDLLLL
ncbi:hypothetical protein QVD17_25509 [Tagetes erecta]|uniref:Uncharacterized protein n=1 Tax=Tagetes erecta TaxID=13708 RepID=A0AAD8KMR2_TARER|nr:hypothetical protein QVD17_25509 [Tagetes erecta]